MQRNCGGKWERGNSSTCFLARQFVAEADIISPRHTPPSTPHKLLTPLKYILLALSLGKCFLLVNQIRSLVHPLSQSRTSVPADKYETFFKVTGLAKCMILGSIGVGVRWGMVLGRYVQEEKEAGRQTVIQVYGYTPNYPRFCTRTHSSSSYGSSCRLTNRYQIVVTAI